MYYIIQCINLTIMSYTDSHDNYSKWIEENPYLIKKCIRCTTGEGDHERTCIRNKPFINPLVTSFMIRFLIGGFVCSMLTRSKS